MAHHHTVEADPKDIQRAQDMWHNFTKGGKYAAYAVAVILLGLAAAFVKFF